MLQRLLHLFVKTFTCTCKGYDTLYVKFYMIYIVRVLGYI